MPSDQDFAAQLTELQLKLQQAGVREAHHSVTIQRLTEELAALRGRERQLEGWLQRASDEPISDMPSILLAALPRSGSVFFFRALEHGLGLLNCHGVSGGVFPEAVVNQHALSMLIQRRMCAHTHISANWSNLIEISPHLHLDRMIVHVRDPRQSMVSWAEFMPAVITRLDPSQALHYRVPDDFASWPIVRQIDWHIDNWLRWSIEWIEAWLRAPDQPWFNTQILYTRFEDMVLDQTAFFDRALDFFGIDHDRFKFPAPPTCPGDRNFRLGRIDEWRDVLTPAQIKRASSMIPDELFERFSWPRH